MSIFIMAEEQNHPQSKVILGDCVQYMHTLADDAFDLAIVDPPYGDAAGSYKRGQRFGGRFCRYFQKNVEQGITTDNANRKEAPTWDQAPSQEYFDELMRVSRNQIIWGANYFSLPPTRCFVVWNKQIPEQFSMAMCEYAWTSFDRSAKMFSMPPQRNEHSGRFHPTEKPIELYAWLIRMFAGPNDKILDTHMGSQSSRIAAYLSGHDYTGCEIDPWYFKKGNERFNRECKGVIKDGASHIIRQTSLF